jgi:hypothetical protein
MISRREFMAGSVALVASGASKRLAPEPESILVNDIHSQLNPTRVLGSALLTGFNMAISNSPSSMDQKTFCTRAFSPAIDQYQ